MDYIKRARKCRHFNIILGGTYRYINH